MEPSNETRANQAQRALDFYNDMMNGDDDATAFADLFKDMFHLLVRLDINNPLRFLYWQLSYAIDEMEREVAAETVFTAAAGKLLNPIWNAADLYEALLAKANAIHHQAADTNIEF